jgi:hypothetical protein
MDDGATVNWRTPASVHLTESGLSFHWAVDGNRSILQKAGFTAPILQARGPHPCSSTLRDRWAQSPKLGQLPRCRLQPWGDLIRSAQA